MAGRIYYETHVAPLLRMQGSFEEFAIDLIKADGQSLQMIANAAERRDEAGKPRSIRLALIRATDRRRYEQELLGARKLARTGERSAETNLQREHEPRNCGSSSSRCSVTICATRSPPSAPARGSSTGR